MKKKKRKNCLRTSPRHRFQPDLETTAVTFPQNGTQPLDTTIVRQYGLCGEFGWVRLLVVCSPYEKPIPTNQKIFAVGKSGPNATFNLFFLGLGWPYVGDFVGFIIIFIQPNRTWKNPKRPSVNLLPTDHTTSHRDVDSPSR